MDSNYPTSLDNFINPQGTDRQSAPSHSGQHRQVNDAVEALEAKVGANSSAVQTSHDYKLGEVTSADKAVGKTATQTLTNKTLGLTVMSGPLDMNGSDLILTPNGLTYLLNDSNGQVTFVAAGADSLLMDANGLLAVSGKRVATNTIAETTANSGVTVDGTLIKDGGVSATGEITTTAQSQLKDNSVALSTYRSEMMFDHVASGCVLTGTGLGTTLGWSLTAGVVYIGGKRLTVAAATGTVTASRDTYFDLLDPGTGSVATLVNTGANIATTNAASPALAANSVRLGIIVSGATNIANAAAINQGQEDRVLPIVASVPYAVTDSLGNLICPRDPSRKILGYRQIITNFTSSTAADITGLSVPVIVPANRRIAITFFASGLNNAANNASNILMQEGATILSKVRFNTPLNQDYQLPPVLYQSSPTTGLHTYKMNSSPDLVANQTINAAGSSPAYIKVELS